MHVHLVMTVIGQDRPGLVESLATLVAEHGGNWLESRMANLGGQFAGILRIQIPKEHQAALLKALPHLQERGLTVTAQAEAALPPVPQPAAPAWNLEVVGHDRPGIVRHIARILAGHQVNVEELHTERSCAPMSGEMLFKARARIFPPKHVSQGALRDELQKFAADIVVELIDEES